MNRIAIVTGTSRGIGAAVASALLERGWDVLGLARGEAPTTLRTRNGYEHAQLDLGDLGALEALCAELPARLALDGRDTIGLVNNAAQLGPVGLTSSLSPADLSRAYDVNVVAPVWLMGLVLRHSRARLRIVNLSSGAAARPFPGWSAYCGAKAALHMSGAVLGLELEEAAPTRATDVAVVAYGPNVVATAMQAEIRAVDEAGFPRRARFQELFENEQLHAPEGPAAEVADLLEADDLPPFSARQFVPA